MDNPYCCFPFQLICDGIQIFSSVSRYIILHATGRTYRTFVAQRMKHVQGGRITLLESPYKVNPGRQVFADVVTLQSLGNCQCCQRAGPGNNNYPAM